MQPLVFSTRFSPAMPLLFQACVTGQAISKAVLDVVKDGTQQPLVLRIELEDVTLSALSLVGADGEVPAESFSLMYRRIQFTSFAQKGTGQSTQVATAAWDAVRRGPR